MTCVEERKSGHKTEKTNTEWRDLSLLSLVMGRHCGLVSLLTVLSLGKPSRLINVWIIKEY